MSMPVAPAPHAALLIPPGHPSPASGAPAAHWQGFLQAAARGEREQACRRLLDAVANDHRGTYWPALLALLPSMRLLLEEGDEGAQAILLQVLSTLSGFDAEPEHALFQPPHAAQPRPLQEQVQQGMDDLLPAIRRIAAGEGALARQAATLLAEDLPGLYDPALREAAVRRAQLPGLALFDFDGTLTEREMFPDFLRAVTPRARVALGSLLFAPLLLGYRLGWVDAHFLRARLVSYCLRGVDAAACAAIGERFAREALPPVLRPRALERLRWHQQRGDTVVVVSGALDVYLAHWCRAQQVDCLCSRLEVVDARLTGRYAGAQCAGEEKARRVRERYDLARYGEIYAYGDTHEDLALLQLAQQRYYRWERMS